MSESTAPVPARRPRRAADGRDRLLDAAARLFAERGISGVSLREITGAAGQRNASVVQYHFGSRAGLVAAIIERHMSVVDADRTTRLDEASEAGAPVEVHQAMRILVEPLAEQLRTDRGRHYLRVVQHLVDLPPDEVRPIPPLALSNPSLIRVSTLLARSLGHLPPRLRRERQEQTTSFLLRALADRAAGPAAPREGRTRTSHELFVANLVDVLVAVLTTPPSSATMATR